MKRYTKLADNLNILVLIFSIFGTRLNSCLNTSEFGQKHNDIFEMNRLSFGAVFASKGYPFKNIFDFTTAGDWDCVAGVERLPALHYSVEIIFLSFGIMDFVVEL